MGFLKSTNVQLHAVNYIADEIADEFPHVAVATLAYGAAVTPPIVTSARPNVVILLAPLGADYAHPFTHPNNKPLRDKVTNWGKKFLRRISVQRRGKTEETKQCSLHGKIIDWRFEGTFMYSPLAHCGKCIYKITLINPAR